HFAGSEQISSENNITGPEIYKGNFGFLKLDDPNQTSFSDRLSQFIWLYNTTESFAVSRFIVEAYQLPPPHLILSIQTDYLNIQNSPCETFKLEGELVRAIQHGLVETIKITNAWIITNGINNVINRLLGEGLRDDVIGYDVPCIEYWNNIPKVVLLLGGNFTTLRALLGYLDNQTPIVVVRV
ncbi:unnamed protein product, partial [Rotaria sp. Silwood2]